MWISNIEIKMIKMTKNYRSSNVCPVFFELFRVVQYFSQLGVQNRSVWEMDTIWMDDSLIRFCLLRRSTRGAVDPLQKAISLEVFLGHDKIWIFVSVQNLWKVAAGTARQVLTVKNYRKKSETRHFRCGKSSPFAFLLGELIFSCF